MGHDGCALSHVSHYEAPTHKHRRDWSCVRTVPGDGGVGPGVELDYRRQERIVARRQIGGEVPDVAGRAAVHVERVDHWELAARPARRPIQLLQLDLRRRSPAAANI